MGPIAALALAVVGIVVIATPSPPPPPARAVGGSDSAASAPRDDEPTCDLESLGPSLEGIENNK